jgi:iron complex outermembrane receptor protein
MTKKPLFGRPRDLLGLGILGGLLTLAAPAMAAEQPEEMIITGSYIKGTPEDAAVPVSVLSQQELLDIGSPSIVEITRNLNVTSGNDGETNQFDGRGAGSGVTTINLRGLGSSRTLVMINGHRQVAIEGAGVDINAMPVTAIGRVEVLKDGAAALYGSDAIGGVVNMITREGFEGLELRASNTFIQENDGDQVVAAIAGWADDTMDAMLAVEYSHRSELKASDRDWALRPFSFNSQGGWSGIGNPGAILPIGNGTGTRADPGCAAVGGAVTGANAGCSFQYTFFDNLVEKQDDYKAYGEFNWDITENHRLHVEGLYALMDMEDWRTSPSYPPQSLFGADRVIAGTHPGLVALRAANPALVGPGLPLGAAGTPVFSLTRYLGSAGYFGDSQKGPRETETFRFGVGLDGSLFNDAINYSFAVNVSQRVRDTTGTDMPVENMAFALDGLGGPNCNQATGTPGVGGCQFFNPFSNAFEFSARTGLNPNFNPAVANSPEMIDWLFEPIDSRTTNRLITWDLVFSGSAGLDFGGGDIDWAAGMQVRREFYELELGDNINRALNPCPFRNPRSVALGNVTQAEFDNCASPTGIFAFGSATDEVVNNRTIYAMFGEVRVPFSEDFDMQLAVRFEDYGGDVGSSIDPKIALRWQATDWLAFRGSMSSTFRGPPQSFLSGRTTSLNFIGAASAFKAVDRIGNPDLGPETAITTNIGAIVEIGGFYGSVDFWRFQFDDAIVGESFPQILAAYTAQGCQNGGAGAPQGANGPITPNCVALRSHVFNPGTTPANLVRIDTNWLNGGRFETSGFDVFMQYDFQEVFGGELSIGGEATYVEEFVVDAAKDINGVALETADRDYVGKLNDGLAYRAMPQIKGSAFVRYINGDHRLTYTLRYIDEYDDDTAPSQPAFAQIDYTWLSDISYNVSLFDGAANVSLTVNNIFDEDPSQASLDLNYDPFNGSPLGRVVKLGVTYTLGAD